MNERIRELSKEAWVWAEQQEYTDPAKEFSDILEQKFAELILKDIDKIVDDLYHSLPLEQAAVLLTLDEQIKAHFYATDEEPLEDSVCPLCGSPDGGTSCGLPDCGLIFGEYNEQQNP
jgi:hypothetical protein